MVRFVNVLNGRPVSRVMVWLMLLHKRYRIIWGRVAFFRYFPIFLKDARCFFAFLLLSAFSEIQYKIGVLL